MSGSNQLSVISNQWKRNKEKEYFTTDAHRLTQIREGMKENICYLPLEWVKEGFNVIRFWNNDILLRTENVLKAIQLKIEELDHPHPPLAELEGSVGPQAKQFACYKPSSPDPPSKGDGVNEE